MDTIPDLFRRASNRFGILVEQLPDDCWTNPTPCTEWDVRGLLDHVVNENLWAPPLVAGETIESVGDRFDGDMLGPDPRAAWRAAAGPAITALQTPGAMERIVHLSFGDMPGAEYGKQLVVDHVVHGWDLARGAGLDDTLDLELVAACYEWGKSWEDMLRSAPDHFAPPIMPADGADEQTALLNLFGRRP